MLRLHLKINLKLLIFLKKNIFRQQNLHMMVNWKIKIDICKAKHSDEKPPNFRYDLFQLTQIQIEDLLSQKDDVIMDG